MPSGCVAIFDPVSVPQAWADTFPDLQRGEIAWQSRESFLVNGVCKRIIGRAVTSPTGDVEVHACNCQDGTVVKCKATADTLTGDVVFQESILKPPPPPPPPGVCPSVDIDGLLLPRYWWLRMHCSMDMQRWCDNITLPFDCTSDHSMRMVSAINFPKPSPDAFYVPQPLLQFEYKETVEAPDGFKLSRYSPVATVLSDGSVIYYSLELRVLTKVDLGGPLPLYTIQFNADGTNSNNALTMLNGTHFLAVSKDINDPFSWDYPWLFMPDSYPSEADVFFQFSGADELLIGGPGAAPIQFFGWLIRWPVSFTFINAITPFFIFLGPCGTDRVEHGGDGTRKFGYATELIPEGITVEAEGCIGGEPLIGACCFPDFTCQQLPGPICDALGGTSLGPFVPCAACPVPPGFGRCCIEERDPTGTFVVSVGCEVTDELTCSQIGSAPLTTTVWTETQPCFPENVCGDIPEFACCLPDGTCIVATIEQCMALGGGPLLSPPIVDCANANCILPP